MELWGGNFQSSHYGSFMVNGTLNVSLPSDIKSHSKIETIVTMTYKGTYRHGHVSQLKIVYEGDNKGETNQSSFSFKGSSGQQHIEFNLEKIEDKTIYGTYTTINPADNGTFELEKGRDTLLGASFNTEGCICI